MITVHEIDLDGRHDVFLVSNFHSDNNLTLTIADVGSGEAFCGSVSCPELQKLASRIRLDLDAFVDITKKAFTQGESDGLKFLYSLEKNCNGYLFKWKSLDSEETKVTIGVVSVGASEYPVAVRDVFVHFSSELVDLRKTIARLEADVKDSRSEKAKAEELLVEAVTFKAKIETELYSKFVLVLNEKKRKIRELSEESDSQQGKKGKKSSLKTKVTRRTLHQISDSDSDDVDGDVIAGNDDTPSTSDSTPSLNLDCNDMETEEAGPSNVKNEAGPSSMKPDDSLLFSDDDIKVSVSPSKIRKRKAANVDVPIIKKFSEKVQETYSQIYDSDSDDLLNRL